MLITEEHVRLYREGKLKFYTRSNMLDGYDNPVQPREVTNVRWNPDDLKRPVLGNLGDTELSWSSDGKFNKDLRYRHSQDITDIFPSDFVHLKTCTCERN